MKTLWQKLKPEYKKQIIKHQEQYHSAPQKLEKRLKEEVIFSHLTISELRDLFVWTNNELIDLKWRDVFGDRFLIEE